MAPGQFSWTSIDHLPGRKFWKQKLSIDPSCLSQGSLSFTACNPCTASWITCIHKVRLHAGCESDDMQPECWAHIANDNHKNISNGLTSIHNFSTNSKVRADTLHQLRWSLSLVWSVYPHIRGVNSGTKRTEPECWNWGMQVSVGCSFELCVATYMRAFNAVIWRKLHKYAQLNIAWLYQRP